LQNIDSLGLNEQELLFLAQTSEQAPHSNYYHEIHGQPELYKIVDILEWLLVKFGSREQSKLTRIHFHCLIYHIIAELDGDKWSNQVSSLVSGSKVAAKQACGFEFDDAAEETLMENLLELRLNYTFDEKKNYQVQISESQFAQLNISNPVIQFRRANIKFYVTPVLVCKKPTKTVGLGDAISSTGLLYSEFN
jgi:ADP-dependent glucokinase